MISAKNSSRRPSGVDSPVLCADPMLFPFRCHGGLCPLRGLWLLTRHMLNSVLILRYVGGKIWPGRSLWTGTSWRWWASLHFFILLTICDTLPLLIVWSHNDFTYFFRRQQMGPFSTRSLTTFHFAADRNTPPSIVQQTFNCLQAIICKLAWRKCFFPLPSKHLLACYKNPNGFTIQTFYSICEIREYINWAICKIKWNHLYHTVDPYRIIKSIWVWKLSHF